MPMKLRAIFSRTAALAAGIVATVLLLEALLRILPVLNGTYAGITVTTTSPSFIQPVNHIRLKWTMLALSISIGYDSLQHNRIANVITPTRRGDAGAITNHPCIGLL